VSVLCRPMNCVSVLCRPMNRVCVLCRPHVFVLCRPVNCVSVLCRPINDVCVLCRPMNLNMSLHDVLKAVTLAVRQRLFSYLPVNYMYLGQVQYM